MDWETPRFTVVLPLMNGPIISTFFQVFGLFINHQRLSVFICGYFQNALCERNKPRHLAWAFSSEKSLTFYGMLSTWPTVSRVERDILLAWAMASGYTSP